MLSYRRTKLEHLIHLNFIPYVPYSNRWIMIVEFQCLWDSLTCLCRLLVRAHLCKGAASEFESWSKAAHPCYMTRAWISLWWLKPLKQPEHFSDTQILLTLAFGTHQFCLHVILVSSKDTLDKMSGSSCSWLSNTRTSFPSQLSAFAPSLSTPHPLTHIPEFSLLSLRHTLKTSFFLFPAYSIKWI